MQFRVICSPDGCENTQNHSPIFQFPVYLKAWGQNNYFGTWQHFFLNNSLRHPLVIPHLSWIFHRGSRFLKENPAMFDWDALDAPKETVPTLAAPTASVENSNRGDLVFTKSWRGWFCFGHLLGNSWLTSIPTIFGLRGMRVDATFYGSFWGIFPCDKNGVIEWLTLWPRLCKQLPGYVGIISGIVKIPRGPVAFSKDPYKHTMF